MKQEDGRGAKLIDWAIEKIGLRNDSQLSIFLKFSRSEVSKIRRCDLITYRFLLRLHDATGLSANEIRAIAGISQFEPGSVDGVVTKRIGDRLVHRIK